MACPSSGASDVRRAVDRRALTEARAKALVCADPGELAALLVARGLVGENVVREKVAVWDDKTQQVGRPLGWKSVDVTFPELVRRSQSR